MILLTKEQWQGAKSELACSAEKLVRDNFTKKFSLDEIASALHVDKSYLLRTFKEVTGLTLLEYHNRLRCSAACEMLERPELSISYIPSEVGYASASHFSQVFRKYVGQTPTEYRNAYLKSLDT